MPGNLGRLNPGIEYQFKVITYTAVCLSENPNVQDFIIYTNKEDVPGFDDIIAKIWYKNQQQPFVYLGQVKHRSDNVNLNNRANSIKKYRDDIKETFAKKGTSEFLKELFDNVPDENVEFWFFCSKYVQNTKNTNPIIVDRIQYDVIPNQTYESIFAFTNGAGCHKLTPHDASICSADFDRFYLLLNQPNISQINGHILNCNKKIFTKETTTQIVAYTTEYLRIGSKGLRKDVFETQLLRLCLSSAMVPPTETIEIYDNLAWLWNKLNLEHDVTIVDQGTVDMKPYVFGAVFEVLKKLLDDAAFNWNKCVADSNKLPGNFNFQKFKELTKTADHWFSRPDVLDTLLIEMWKCDYIALILNADCNISILTKYQHLHKKIIVLDKDNKISEKIRSTGLRVCINMDDLQDDSLRSALFESTYISLQGRAPVRFANVLNSHKNLMRDIRCSHLLNLIKKTFKIFVERQCLEHGTSLVFIISHDSKSNKEMSDDWKSSIKMSLKSTSMEENVIINCASSDVEKHTERVKKDPKLRNYTIYRLKRHYPNERLEYLAGDVLKIKRFLTDENGNEINFREDKLTPIVGAIPFREEEDDDNQYIPRYLRKATIKQSFFEFEEERILFLTGNVDALDANIKGKIIKKVCGDIKTQIEKRLSQRKTAFVVVENERFEEHWSMFTFKKYPLFYIHVDNGALVLLKYKNYPNLTAYISYEGQKFQDKSFFEETTNEVNVLTGEAGLGKTRLLHFLFERYDEHNYVLFCDLKDYLNELRQGRKSGLLKRPLKYILSRCEHSIPSNALLPNSFFNSLCEFHHRTNRLLLIMDSFDEVLRVHKKEVLDLVRSIVERNVRVIIACRPIAESVLINNFEVGPVKIEHMDKNSAITYLRSRNLTDAEINSTPEEFLENPTYLKYLTTIAKDIFPRCNPSNTFNLYKTLTEKKIEAFCMRRAVTNNSTCQREDIMKVYKLLALVLIFGKEVIEDQAMNYDDIVEESIGTYKIDLGIIIGFDDNLPIFASRTFAEFLVALWIYENSNTMLAQKIYKRLLDTNQRNVRLLLDNYVCENLRLHQAILSGNLPLVKSLCEENKDYLQDMDDYNRTPLHLAASCCTERTRDCHPFGKSSKYKILDTIVRHMNGKKMNFNRRDLLMKWTWFDYIKQNKNSFEVFCQHDLSATLEKYLDLGKVTISQHDVDTALSNNLLHTVVVLLKHNPSLVKKYFDKTVECSLKSNQLDPVLSLIELRNYENEEFKTFRRICQNMHQTTAPRHSTNFQVIGEFTPLHLACMYGNLEVVKQLVKFDANLYNLDKFKNIPLHYAVMQGSTEIVSKLVKVMSSRNAKNAKYLRVKFVKTEGLGGIHYINVENTLGRTPLHIASMKGNQDIVQILIRNGGNIDSCDENGNSSLYFAALCGHTGILKILLENGANGNAKDSSGSTVMHHAAQMGRVDIVNALLIEDVDVNVKDNNGNTPLHNAVFYEQINVIKSLIRRGANTRIQNNSGNTVLHSAVASERTDVVKLLLESGIGVNLMGYNGRTPLHMAAYNGQTDILKILVDNCADVNARDQHGDTALHCAAQAGNANIVQMLIQKKVDINAKDCNGNTPLHTAVHFGQENTFEILLDNGADVNIKNDKNETVLYSVSAEGKIELLQMLLKKGFDVNLTGCNVVRNDCRNILLSENADIIHPTPIKSGTNRIDTGNDNGTALHLAAEKGDIETIKSLLRKGTDVNLRHSNGMTPLFIAAYHEQTDALALLLENGAGIGIGNDSDDHTALHLAAEEGKADIVEALLKMGFDINLKGFNGNTPLCTAASNGYTDILVLLLENGADINIRNDQNETALHLAARQENTDTLKVLLQWGMHVNLRGSNGNTPLCIAAYHGQTDALRFLLELRADINVKNYQNDTALHLASEEGRTDAVEVLLENGMDINLRGSNGNTPLGSAAHIGQTDTLKLLLENGADINIRNDMNDTALHLAVPKGNRDIIEILLKKGIGINLGGIHGNTPLCLAAYKGQTDALRFLLEKGADMNIRNNQNDTALHLAAREGKLDVVDILLQRGMDVNLRGINGNTPASVAAYSGQTDTLKLLLERDADISSKNNQNDTALHMAAYIGNAQIVNILLKHEINVNLMGYNGNTALCIAASNGYTDILALLREKGADVSIRNNDNNTALDLAAGKPEAVEILNLEFAYTNRRTRV